MSEDFSNPLTRKIVVFLRGIGLPVTAGELTGKTFLPGILIKDGGLVVDESKLAHPGDLLHEGGHFAVKPAAKRGAAKPDVSKNMGDEIGAICWSYAALTHLGIDPAKVFHPEGYKGASESFIENYTQVSRPACRCCSGWG